MSSVPTSPPQGQTSRFHRLRRRIRLGSFFIAIGLILVSGVSIIFEAHNREQAVIANNANLARVLLEQVDRILISVDLSLSALEKDLASRTISELRSPQVRRDLLKRHRSTLRGIDFTFLIEQKSREVTSFPEAAEKRRDWPSFLDHLQGKPEGLQVGNILKSTHEKPVIPLSRTFRHASGDWLVGAALTPEYFTEFFSQLAADEDLRINMILNSGPILLRHPYREDLIGLNLRGVSRVYSEVDKSDSGWFYDISPVFNEETFYFFQKSKKNPVFVLIVYSRDKLWKPWVNSSLQRLALTLIALLGIFIFVVLLELGFKRLEREVQRKNRDEEEARVIGRLSALGEFGGQLSRDLNLYLHRLKGQTSRLEENLRDPESVQILARIRGVLQRAQDLLGQVLSFSTESTTLSRPLDLKRLTLEHLSLWATSLPKGIRVQTRLEDVPLILGREGPLEQVLLNLITNALDAMGGAGTLSIRLENQKEFLIWSLSDSGVGIPLELQEKVFEPLFTTKTPGHGTGMGLATAKKILTEHGAEISIRSRPGDGTHVEIRFPLRPVVAENLSPARFRGGRNWRRLFPQTLILQGDSARRFRLGIWALTGLFCAIMLTGTSLQILADQEQVEKPVIHNAGNLARVISEQLESLIFSLNIVFQETPSPKGQRRVLQKMSPHIEEVLFLFHARQGSADLLLSSTDCGEMKFEQVISSPSSQAPGLLSVGSVKVCPQSGHRFIPLWKKRLGPDGEEWIGAALDFEVFDSFFRDLGGWKVNGFVVVSDEGNVILRYPSIAKTEGRNYKGQSQIWELGERAPQGWFYEKSPVDGVLKMTSYRRVAGSPLTVLILRRQDEIFADWRSASLSRGLATFLSCVALLVLAGLLDGQVRRLEREENDRRHRSELGEKLQQKEAVGRWAGSMAHDFNNILTIFFGQVDLLKKHLPAGHQAHAEVDLLLDLGLQARNQARHVLSSVRAETQLKSLSESFQPDPSRQTGNLRVAFVDDDGAVVELARAFFALSGTKAELFTHPQKLLDRIREEPHFLDVLMTDIQMAPFNGIELAREARRIRPDLPVLFATGTNLTLENLQAELGGQKETVRMIRKPYHFQDLLKAVEDLEDQEG